MRAYKHLYLWMDHLVSKWIGKDQRRRIHTRLRKGFVNCKKKECILLHRTSTRVTFVIDFMSNCIHKIFMPLVIRH